MLDPSILVGPQGTVHGGVTPLVPDAQAAAIELAQQAEARTIHLAAAIEFLSGLDAAKNLNEAAQQASSSLCEILSASQILILWRKNTRSRLDVIADSADSAGHRGDTEYRLAAAAGEEIVARDAITHWPSSAEGAFDRHATMAIAQMAKHFSVKTITGAPLSDSDGHDRGVVLALNDSSPSLPNVLSAIAAPLGSKFAGIERLQPTSFETTLRSFVETLRGSKRNLMIAAGIGLVVLMSLPLHYKIGAELELHPVEHRFIAVPFDGPLESSYVRPGDLVDQGDLLAKINPREIEYELAGIRAELNRAVQEKKGLMVSHEFAASKIAGLESDRLRMQSDLLEYRRDNLEIRSPITGVVVTGDLKESEGMPMTRGETLFEIAPLREMVVEIAVPESEIAYVRKGMPVSFYVHSLPGRRITGNIDRVHPRAELRNHDNVFIAEMRFPNPENLFRPGMRGRAKVVSERHPLGWNLFHKAYFAMRHAVGG